MLFCFFEALLLVAALSLDAFAASMAFGAQGIRVPPASVGVISAVCSGVLGISLLLGRLAAPFFPASAAKWTAFALLGVLGVLRLFDSIIKAWIRKSCGDTADVEFHFLSFHFLLRVYADSTVADVNQSKSLSAGEAASLALALSLDGLATGFGAGIVNASLWLVVGLSLLTSAAAVLLGCLLGRRVAWKSGRDISWAGGAMLILLSILKLV